MGTEKSEAVYAMAAAAAELDLIRAVELDLDQETVHFLFKIRCDRTNRSLREELVQKAAENCVSRAR